VLFIQTMWLLFAFSGPVFWAVSTHIDKYLVDRYFRRSDTTVLMVFTSAIGILFLPPIAIFDSAVLKPGAGAILVMTVSGILYMGAMLFYLRAIQREEASIVAALFQASTLFTFLLGWLFLHEKLGWSQGGGCALVVAGALVLSQGGTFTRKKFKLRLVLLMLAATFVLALSSVLFKFFAVENDYWTTTFWNFLGEALFGFAILLAPDYRRQFFHLFRKHPGPVIGVNAANELINLGGGLGVRYAMLLAPVAVVSAIAATTTLFVFGFGILLTLFLPKLGHEDLSRRNMIRKALGAVLISAGVALVEAL
jgi:drug/metabolite transporter (DMT)-like permease